MPPLLHDGAPAYRMQRAIMASGLPVADVPTNRGGLALHRGRAGFDAATRYRPRHHYAGLPSDRPHYMGVPDGAQIWDEIEQRHAELLDADAKQRLLEHLGDRLAVLGTAVLDE